MFEGQFTTLQLLANLACSSADVRLCRDGAIVYEIFGLMCFS